MTLSSQLLASPALSHRYGHDTHDLLVDWPTPHAKAYSPADYGLLKFETLLDARRVKELIARAPPDSTKDSVKFLIENGTIDIADFVGIEHYVLGNGGFVVKTRKLHAKKVLLQQHEQQRHQPEDPVERLAKVAEESSHKSTYHARVRAAVVAGRAA
eukprot:scaffold6729_cov135-Skeletonema_menzelii.AAC.9